LNKSIQTFLLILLIPTISESIDATKYLISIPGSPFSLGRLSFILVGFIRLFYIKKEYFASKIFISFLLIFFGAVIGAFFSNQIELSLSRSIGQLLIFFASIGVASLWRLVFFRKYLDLFFLINYIYWTYYVYELTLSKGFSFVAYGELFLENGVVNHHVVGINISVSCVYLAMRFFYQNNHLNVWGYLIIFFGVLTCFLSETRSNLLFTLITFMVILASSKFKFNKLLFISIPAFYLLISFLSGIASENDILYQRFDLSDSEFQTRTTFMRLDFILGFLTEFLSNPLGKGVFGVQIAYGSFESTLLHNQYLTFILAGGVIALFGVVFLLFYFFYFFKSALKIGPINKFDYAIIFSLFTFFVTLFSLEYSGLSFFLYISLLLHYEVNFRFRFSSMM
jgi:hypothetical protein